MSRSAIHVQQDSETLALAAFQRAARAVPAYREMLSARGVDPARIAAIDDFRRLVPILGKREVFGSHDLPALCVGGTLEGVAAAFTSSGHSGAFSFGVETRQDMARTEAALNGLFAAYFAADRRRVLVINALPMGVRVPVSIALCMDVGPHVESVLGSVRKIAPHCDHTVIVGEQPLLKEVLERGLDEGIDWRRIPTSLVTGAEVMPEHFRTYAEGILGIAAGDPSHGMVLASLGISEVGLSIGQETPATIALRRAAHADAGFRESLLGPPPFVPTLVAYDPRVHFIETPPDAGARSRLVVTTLDPDRALPLIRYGTGDWARVIPPGDIAAAAERCGLPPGSIPAACLAVWGRGVGVKTPLGEVFPEQVKEALYASGAIVRSLTGNFKLEAGDDGVRVRCQLKHGRTVAPAERASLERLLTRTCRAAVELELIGYQDFPEGLSLSYQHKFRYVRGA